MTIVPQGCDPVVNPKIDRLFSLLLTVVPQAVNRAALVRRSVDPDLSVLHPGRAVARNCPF